MRRASLLGAALILLLTLALLALYATLPIWSTWPFFRAELQRRLALAGYRIEAGSLRVGYGFDIEALDVRVLSEKGRVVATAPELELTSTLRTAAPYVATAATLTRARLVLTAGDGENAFGDLLSWRLPDPIERLIVDDGEIVAETWKGRGTWTFDQTARGLEASVQTLALSDNASRRAAEKLAGHVRRSSDGEGRTTLEVEVTGGAALWDEILLDLGESPATARAEVPAGAEALENLSVELKRLFKLTGRIAWKAGKQASLQSLSLTLATSDLSAAYARLVREPFGGAYPALEELEISGNASLLFALDRRPQAWTFHGKLDLGSLQASSPAFVLDGVQASLPFYSRTAEVPHGRQGTLKAKAFRLGGIDFGSVDIAAIARAGRVEATHPVQLSIGGGTLRLTDLALVERDDHTAQLRARGTLAGVDVRALTTSVGWPAVDGSLEGDLGGMALDEVALSVTGSATASVYGGRIHLRDMSVGSPFDRVSIFRLDAVAEDLDLALLTQSLPVGRIRGRLEGHVNDLEIAAGQLQSFDVDLHSVERRGVAQTISVGAVSSLSALGGSDASLGNLALRLVREFRYSKLGVRGTLRNDTFELRGVESGAQGEYLVRGSLLPPTVNVISHTSSMSFTEMLERLRRMRAGEGEAAHDPPAP